MHSEHLDWVDLVNVVLGISLTCIVVGLRLGTMWLRVAKNGSTDDSTMMKHEFSRIHHIPPRNRADTIVKSHYRLDDSFCACDACVNPWFFKLSSTLVATWNVVIEEVIDDILLQADGTLVPPHFLQ